MSGVDEVLITAELASRPSRAPDYEAESRALGLLAQEMETDPRRVLQKCAELVMELCEADSAGISILEAGGASGMLRWQAAAGAFAPNLHGTMPQEASPCGTVMERDCVLLFKEAERFFPALQGFEPRIYENLLTPWHSKGKAVGTLWAIKHSPEGRFDAEDARLLQNLSHFAAAAFQMHQNEQALASDLASAEVLRSLSERLVAEDSLQSIYEDVLSATIAITGADAGTVQIYDPARKSLELIASRNFSRTITEFFHRVDAGSRTACGVALKTGAFAFADFPEEGGDPDVSCLPGEGIQSAVAYPLMSRTGSLLGMLNAHWRDAKHRLNDREQRFLGLLARQAADLIEQRRSQSALRESEEQQRLMVELVPALLWSASSDGRTISLNERWLTFTGQSEAETQNYGWLDAIHPDELPGSRAAFQQAFATGEPLERQHRIHKAGDGWRWHLVAMSRCATSTARSRVGSVQQSIFTRAN